MPDDMISLTISHVREGKTVPTSATLWFPSTCLMDLISRSLPKFCFRSIIWSSVRTHCKPAHALFKCWTKPKWLWFNTSMINLVESSGDYTLLDFAYVNDSNIHQEILSKFVKKNKAYSTSLMEMYLILYGYNMEDVSCSKTPTGCKKQMTNRRWIKWNIWSYWDVYLI